MNSDFETLLRQYYQAWSGQDPAMVLSFFHDDSSFEDLAFGAKFCGLDEIRSFVDITYAGSPDFRVEPTRIVAGSDAAAAAWTMSGTHRGDLPGLPATGERFEVRASSIVTFRRGKIQEIVDYWNPVEFQRSVGLAT